MLSGKSMEWGVRTWLLLTPAFPHPGENPFDYLRLINYTVQCKSDCPLRSFCRAPSRMASGLPSPLRSSSAQTQACAPSSVKRERAPPGKPEEQGPLNYGAAFLAPLRKAQAPQLNNSPPQEDPVVPDTAKVGQASAWPWWGWWGSEPLPHQR